MNFSASRWLGAGVLALALPLVAAAQEAYTNQELDLHAGPSRDYPLVARLGPGQPLDVVGCTRDYDWCDVVLPDGLRGWARASRLVYPYRGSQVPLAAYGATIGVPIVGFAIGNYWGEHYRDRPWYGERRWWGGRPPPPPQPGWRPTPPPPLAWTAPPQPGWQGRPPGAYGPPPGYRPDGDRDRGQRPQGGFEHGRPPTQTVPVNPGFRPPAQGFPVPVPVPVPVPQHQAPPQPHNPNAFPGPFDPPRAIDRP